jgi:hypothetical protein
MMDNSVGIGTVLLTRAIPYSDMAPPYIKFVPAPPNTYCPGLSVDWRRLDNITSKVVSRRGRFGKDHLMEELKLGKWVVGWIKTSCKNSNQVLVGLGLEHRNTVQCQVVLEAICCGSVLPAAKRGWNSIGSHNKGEGSWCYYADVENAGKCFDDQEAVAGRVVGVIV